MSLTDITHLTQTKATPPPQAAPKAPAAMPHVQAPAAKAAAPSVTPPPPPQPAPREAPKETAAPQIQGRMDAIEGRRLYGWVWDRSRPDERLLVRVLLNGRMVASTTADKQRIDLRRNGIGDGSYAFEVELTEAVALEADRLTVVAVSPATGEETVLRVPSLDERAMEAAISAPLSRVLDQLAVLIAAQRRSQIIQRESVEAMRGTAEQVEKMASNEDGIGAALEMVRSNQEDLARRVSDVEVFLLRFDKTLSDFDDRIRDIATAADRPMRRAVSLLVMLGAISSVSAIAVLVKIFMHRGGF